MSDDISREAAIKLILSGRVGDDSPFECPEECNSMLEWAADEVAKMPTAEKRGHWNEDWLPSISGGSYQVWRCSECESAFNWRMKYCGHCGARMEEVER